MADLERYRKKIRPEVVELLHEMYENLGEKNGNRAPFYAISTELVYSQIQDLVLIDPANLSVFESKNVAKRRIEFQIIHLILPLLRQDADELKSNPYLVEGLLNWFVESLEEETLAKIALEKKITDEIIELLLSRGAPITMVDLVQGLRQDYQTVSSIVSDMVARGELDQNSFGFIRLLKPVHSD